MSHHLQTDWNNKWLALLKFDGWGGGPTNPPQTCQKIVGGWVGTTMDMKTPPTHYFPENSGQVGHMETDSNSTNSLTSISSMYNFR